MTPAVAIQDLIGRYFDALYNSDAALLAEVMHPGAIYASADETPLLYRTMEKYLRVVEARPSPASRAENREDEVFSLGFAGENTAFARVGCAIGQRRFVDFLTLVRVEGRWWIMSKVFQIIEKPH
ncbi:MAG TPA: nuclear transport factor 2 family protein [Sphingorhabdus sp.]|nr:nuclear transport factor 2 family protein [Sphingorhabdus sp.]